MLYNAFTHTMRIAIYITKPNNAKILQKTKRNIAKKENNKGITIQTLKAEAGIIIQFH